MTGSQGPPLKLWGPGALSHFAVRQFSWRVQRIRHQSQMSSAHTLTLVHFYLYIVIIYARNTRSVLPRAFNIYRHTIIYIIMCTRKLREYIIIIRSRFVKANARSLNYIVFIPRFSFSLSLHLPLPHSLSTTDDFPLQILEGGSECLPTVFRSERIIWWSLRCNEGEMSVCDGSVSL